MTVLSFTRALKALFPFRKCHFKIMSRSLVTVLVACSLSQAASGQMNMFSSKDRVIGSFMGMAVGDALGTTLEFRKRDTYDHLTDIVGGGPFKLKAGQWTDDTSMALCIADSLLEKQGFDPQDIMIKFVAWWQNGYNSVTGYCFDIGTGTRKSLQRFIDTQDPFSGKHIGGVGNGTIMRLAPVVLFAHDDYNKMIELAEQQSWTTHGQLAVDCAKAMAHVMWHFYQGKDTFPPLKLSSKEVQDILASRGEYDWRNKSRDQIFSSGYCLHSLEAALWCIHNTNSFKEAVLLAANLGDDADTVAAITGQLAGALYGLKGIPESWIEKIDWKEKLLEIAEALYQQGLKSK